MLPPSPPYLSFIFLLISNKQVLKKKIGKEEKEGALSVVKILIIEAKSDRLSDD